MKAITVGNIVAEFKRGLTLNWLMTLLETALMTLIPLFIGYAIDGLLEQNTDPLMELVFILLLLIAVSVGRRLYDTRVFGNIRVNTAMALDKRSENLPVSTLNARLGMGRELVDFLEFNLPQLANALIQLVISFIILFSFSPYLAFSALLAALLMLAIYALFHQMFYRLISNLTSKMNNKLKCWKVAQKDGCLLICRG